MQPEILLFAKQVSLSFASESSERIVLSDIELNLFSGETLALLGPSGSGKSALLRVLAGLLPPTSGQINFLGKSLYPMRVSRHRELSRDLGIAFQKGGLIDSLTVSENLRLPLLEAMALSESENGEIIEAALQAVGLDGTEALFPRELSGGMQKRLGIARAFLLAKKLVILDDPTAGLDPVTSVAILDLVAELKIKKSLTVILVGSQPEEVLALSDRVAFIEDGRLLSVGTLTEVLAGATETVKQYFSREILL